MWQTVPRFGISALSPHARKLSVAVGNSLKAQRPPRSRFLKPRLEEKALGIDTLQATPALSSVAPAVSSSNDASMLASSVSTGAEERLPRRSLTMEELNNALPPPPPFPAGASPSQATSPAHSASLGSSFGRAQASAPLSESALPPDPAMSSAKPVADIPLPPSLPTRGQATQSETVSSRATKDDFTSPFPSSSSIPNTMSMPSQSSQSFPQASVAPFPPPPPSTLPPDLETQSTSARSPSPSHDLHSLPYGSPTHTFPPAPHGSPSKEASSPPLGVDAFPPPPPIPNVISTPAPHGSLPKEASSPPLGVDAFPPPPPIPNVISTPAPHGSLPKEASSPPLGVDAFPPPPPIPNVISTPAQVTPSPSSELPPSPLFPPPPPVPNGVSTSPQSATLPSSAPLDGSAFPPPPAAPSSTGMTSESPTPQAATSTTTSKTPSRPLTAQEQYEKLKHFLPMTKVPETPKPKPEELHVGMKLRVEWTGSWWAAKVKEATETHVKISYDTWSSNYDEVMPRDCGRFWLRPPGDKDADEEDAARQAAMPGGSDRIPTYSGRQRPFVPKPYNPEKEFQKRQLRLREKIAAMQRSKLGDVDSSLESLKDLRMPKYPSSPQAASTASVYNNSELENPVHLQSGNGSVAPPVGMDIPAPPSDVSASPPVGSAAPQAVGETSVAPPVAMDIPAPPSNVSSSPPVGSAIPQATADTRVTSSQSPEPKQSPLAAVVETKAPETAAASESPAGRGSVKWEEVLTDTKERYYHELATGRTQWDLPADGWIELIADDDSRYYWEPSTNTTQWSVPV